MFVRKISILFLSPGRALLERLHEAHAALEVRYRLPRVLAARVLLPLHLVLGHLLPFTLRVACPPPAHVVLRLVVGAVVRRRGGGGGGGGRGGGRGRAASARPRAPPRVSHRLEDHRGVFRARRASTCPRRRRRRDRPARSRRIAEIAAAAAAVAHQTYLVILWNWSPSGGADYRCDFSEAGRRRPTRARPWRRPPPTRARCPCPPASSASCPPRRLRRLHLSRLLHWPG